MNSRFAIAAIGISISALATAQNVQTGPQVDPVLDAIQEFSGEQSEKTNEVTVVLDPVGESTSDVESKPETDKEDEKAEAVAPPAETPAVLVTGKPPEDTTLAPTPEDGLSVRVESLKNSGGTIDPARVSLKAPFPAKPLARTPEGWHLDAANNAPPFTREVEISPGTRITLSIRPHLLVPDADGSQVFAIPEPGYDNTLGYEQTSTVGAILSNSIARLDDDSRRLGNAIESLQQLLVSLPKPPEPQPEEKPAITPRKR